MKFKLVECHSGREFGFNQDIIWFIQGTEDNKNWNNYIWKYNHNSPAIVYEKESYHCQPRSAFLTIDEANEAFDKIIDYYKKQLKENQIRTLREVVI